MVKTTEKSTVYAACCIRVQQQLYGQTKYHKTKGKGESKVKTLLWCSLFFWVSVSYWLISHHWSPSLPLENIRKLEFFSFFLRCRKRSLVWNVLKNATINYFCVLFYLAMIWNSNSSKIIFWCSCSANRSAPLFIIHVSSHSHIKRKQVE